MVVILGFDEQGGLSWKLDADRLRDCVREKAPAYAGREIDDDRAPCDPGALVRGDSIPFG